MKVLEKKLDFQKLISIFASWELFIEHTTEHNILTEVKGCENNAY